MARTEQSWRCRGLTIIPRDGETIREAKARVIQRLYELGLGNPLAHAQTERNPEREAA